MTGPQDTFETQDWTIRQIGLKTYYLAVEMNGGLRDVKRTVYGAPELGLVGLVEEAAETCAYRDRMVAIVRVLKWVAGGLGAALLAILTLVIQHVL